MTEDISHAHTKKEKHKQDASNITDGKVDPPNHLWIGPKALMLQHGILFHRAIPCIVPGLVQNATKKLKTVFFQE